MKNPTRNLFPAVLLIAAFGTNAAFAQQGSAAGDTANADNEFVQEAAKSGMMEVETSKIAVERADSPKVKSFAKKMVSDHGKANQKLMKLAQGKHLSLPDAQAMAPQVSALQQQKGHEFDMAYLQAAGPDAHQKAVTLFEQEAKSGKDADLRKFAKQTLPTLKDHLKMARTLQSDVGK